MKPFHVTVLTIILASCLLPAQPAADPSAGRGESDNLFMLGPGLLITDTPYKGVDSDVLAIPMFLYKTERLTLFGPRATYSLIGEKDKWSLDAVAKLRFEGYDDDDDVRLNGMDDRDRTVEMGLRYIRDLDFAVFTADFTHDILGEHDGFECSANLSRAFRECFNLPSLTLTPSAGVNFRSKKLNDYYYGVKTSEAAAGRPRYTAGSSAGFLTGLRADYRLDERWNLFGLLSVEWLSSEITDSPLVGKHYTMSLLAGAMYKF